jgi:hypothetical protein
VAEATIEDMSDIDDLTIDQPTIDQPTTDQPATEQLTIEHLAIDPERLAAMRAAGADDFGNAWTRRDAEGWEPLRCCLRRPQPGEPIALICFTPWTEPSPWAEAGPVFVHHGPCGGYADAAAYPEAFLESPSIINPFDRSGARAYEHITFVDPQDDHEAAVRAVLAQPEVAYAHVRSATAGCFTFAVRRAA